MKTETDKMLKQLEASKKAEMEIKEEMQMEHEVRVEFIHNVNIMQIMI
jgi:hypothetical protein